MLNKFLNNNVLKNLELLSFKTRKARYGKRQGMHASIKKGSGLEFSDYRAYAMGDNLKNIDWNVYAKTEKLYIKEFKEYQNLNFFIYLDSSASMSTPPKTLKLTQATYLSSALSYIALINNENLYLATSSGNISPKICTARGFQTAVSFLDNIKISKENSFYKNINIALNKIKFPGIAVCISDFLMPFEDIRKSIDKMRAKNLEIKLIYIFNPKFLDDFSNDASIYIDSETDEEKTFSITHEIKKNYKENLSRHINKIRDYALKHGIDFMPLKENDDIVNFLHKSNLCN